MSKFKGKVLIPAAILPILFAIYLKINNHALTAITSMLALLFFFTAIFLQLDANIALYVADVIVQYRPSSLANAFKDKVTLITGASDGIGAEIARQLSSKTSAKIILLARTKEKLDKVLKECQKLAEKSSSGASIVIAVGDVTQGDIFLSNLMQKSLEQLKQPHLDIVILSAGRGYQLPFKRSEIDLIRSIFELNVMGAISTTKAFLNHCSNDLDKEKQIILLSSLAGKMPVALAAGYSASKAAVNLFFDSLRAERMKDLRITTVCPGPVATDIFRASAVAQGDDFTKEKFERMKVNLDMMSAERAAELILAGCVFKPSWLFYELWIATQPLLYATYLNQIFPDLIKHLAYLRMKKKEWR